jgi:hypothetical protein
MALRVRLAASLGAASLALVAGAGAATLEDAPPESRAQVAAAKRALAPAFLGTSGSARRLAAGDRGTIEAAIDGYAPGRFHAVSEGALPPKRAGGTCKAGMANVLGRFCVDRWEGTLVERKPDGSESPASPYHPPEDGHVYIAQSRPGVIPQAYVSATQAKDACRAAGKRLCEAVEWRAACAGSQGTAYPYGPVKQGGVCHDTGASPMLAYHADTMKRGWGRVELNDPRNNQLEGTVAKTGAHPDCVTDSGAFDMVGNLHEWTADPNGTFQGGYWLDTSLHGDGCAYRTIAHPADYHDYSTGFRCCADLEGGAAP